MSTGDLFGARPALEQAFAALESDLVHDDGPAISTMRNYRFAILTYDPTEEYAMRRHAQRLIGTLKAKDWVVLTLDLQALLLERLRAQGDDYVDKLVTLETRLGQTNPDRGLGYLKKAITPLVEGADGLAADCIREIETFLDANPDSADRTLLLIGRAAGVYPFYRLSALLRHLDGRTRHVPVVLLYPGKRDGQTGLRFMSELNADNDYRPRIYGTAR